MRDRCCVHVVDFREVQDDDADGWQGTRVDDPGFLAETSDTSFAVDRPVPLGLRTVESAVGGGVVGLDRLEDGRLETVGIGEEEGLVEAEDADVVW